MPEYGISAAERLAGRVGEVVIGSLYVGRKQTNWIWVTVRFLLEIPAAALAGGLSFIVNHQEIRGGTPSQRTPQIDIHGPRRHGPQRWSFPRRSGLTQ